MRDSARSRPSTKHATTLSTHFLSNLSRTTPDQPSPSHYRPLPLFIPLLPQWLTSPHSSKFPHPTTSSYPFYTPSPTSKPPLYLFLSQPCSRPLTPLPLPFPRFLFYPHPLTITYHASHSYPNHNLLLSTTPAPPTRRILSLIQPFICLHTPLNTSTLLAHAHLNHSTSLIALPHSPSPYHHVSSSHHPPLYSRYPSLSSLAHTHLTRTTNTPSSRSLPPIFSPAPPSKSSPPPYLIILHGLPFSFLPPGSLLLPPADTRLYAYHH